MIDALIIGGSVAGISAGLQLARARRSVRIADAGAPRNRFAAHAHGVYGHDGANPLALRTQAMDQFLAYPTAGLITGTVDQLRQDGDTFVATLADGEVIAARRLVLAHGVIDQLPDLDGFAACWGRSVLHCPYCHGYEIAGTSWGALVPPAFASHMLPLYREWTDDLTLFADGAPIDPETRALADRLAVRIVPGRVERLAHRDGAIEAVVTADGPVPVDALFAPRMVAIPPLAAALGCTIAQGPLGPHIEVDARGQTSVPGVFAAGDAAQPMHSIPFAIGSGCAAGSGAHQSLVFAH
jgi:thioredoxin reductase